MLSSDGEVVEPRPRPTRHPCGDLSPSNPDRDPSPNRALHGLRSSCRFISFTGDHARNIYPVGKAFKLVCHQSNFRTLTRYTPAAHCGRHAGQWPTREECASAAHSKPLSRTTCHGAASAAAIPAIGSPPAQHLAVEEATAAALAATTTVQHKEGRAIESAARVDGAAALFC